MKAESEHNEETSHHKKRIKAGIEYIIAEISRRDESTQL